MTDPIDYLIDTDGGQRTITIDPINITLSTGVLYSTGEYQLKEGDVGIGTITFTGDKDWTFDGITEISETDISHIARFIRRMGNPGALRDVDSVDYTQAEPVLPVQREVKSKSLNIIVGNNGKPVDVRVEMNYPFYDVSVAGKTTAQIEQDHHSNWFVTKGQLDDAMVQEIGRRISQYISAA
jgi:hypothetical protein